MSLPKLRTEHPYETNRNVNATGVRAVMPLMRRHTQRLAISNEFNTAAVVLKYAAELWALLTCYMLH